MRRSVDCATFARVGCDGLACCSYWQGPVGNLRVSGLSGSSWQLPFPAWRGHSDHTVGGVCKHTGLLQVSLLACVTASPRPLQIAHVDVGYTAFSGTLRQLRTEHQAAP